MIIINDTLGAYGGGQTLMLRMSQWLMNNNHQVMILCDDDSNQEIRAKVVELGVKVAVANQWDLKAIKNIFDKCEEGIELCINFAWNQYLNIECLKKKYHLSIKNILYCIHPDTFKKGANVKPQFFKKLIVNHYKKIYEEMNDNRSLVMMDEINKDRTDEYLNTNLTLTNPIIRIPIFIEEVDKDKIINESYKSSIIFTACRAEIPFKGYVLGLVDDFAKLKKEYPNLELWIVSSGNDIKSYEDKIASQEENVRKAITLKYWMPYNEVNKLLLKAKVVTGLGTTVLDSSKQYKVVVPVVMYTVENLSCDFFANRPECINFTSECHEPAINVLKKALDMSYEEFYALSVKGHDMVKKHYDINVVMDSMLKVEPINNDCVLHFSQRFVHLLGNFYRKFRYRNNTTFDYKTIKKESN